MKNILLCTLLLPSLSYASKKFNEGDLLNWSKGRAPMLEEIQTTLLGTQTSRNQVEEKYAAEIFGLGSYAETNERPIIQFIPVFSPIKQAQLGVRKKFSYGLDSQLAATADQRSASSRIGGTYDNVTTTTLSFTMQIDLWKDLLGRISNSERENADLEAEKADLDKEIRTKVFSITLRRIYWNLVAIHEQLKITERLKVTSGQQLQDAKKRLQNSIGDSGEVARYEAQVASREGQIIFLKYQQENLFKQLKNLLPDLGNEELELSDYDLNNTQAEIVHCSEVIMKEMNIPYNFTKYDEVIALLKEVKSNQRKINERYSDIDLKLFGTVKSTGVGSDLRPDSSYQGSYGDAVKDMKNNNRSGYEAGINFTMPLGSAKEDTKKTKSLYDEKRINLMIDQSEAQLMSTHTQLSKSVKLIQDVIVTQRISTAALEKRLKVIRQKYSQARISVNDVILDQDALLSSEFSIIDAQLQAVNVVLDYLTVFTETPCSFNRN
jgi:outer membrane protein TolC